MEILVKDRTFGQGRNGWSKILWSIGHPRSIIEIFIKKGNLKGHNIEICSKIEIFFNNFS